MSYIYEALKRAESENARAIGAPAALRRPALFAAKWRWWLWLLIGVLGANAALVVALVLFRGSRSPGATTGPTGSTARGAGEVTSRSSAESANAPPPAALPVQAADGTAAPVAKPPARTVTPAAPAPRRPATAVRPSTKGVDPPAAASTPAAITEARPASPPPVGATAAVSPPGTPVAPPASAAVPQTTPPPTVDEPKLKVQVVVYSDVPAQRMVFIDGRRYKEGDKVDAETVVERITPEGAVVTHRGESFALTSGRP